MTKVRLIHWVWRGLAPRSFVVAALVATVGVLVSGATGQEQEGPRLPADACGSELQKTMTTLGSLGDSVGFRLYVSVTRATTLFRFRRTADAMGRLDSARERLRGAWGQGVAADMRAEAIDAIAAFRSCLSRARPPRFGSLTVQVFTQDDSKPDGKGASAGSGVSVRVDGHSIGKTGGDGTLTAPVPSGDIVVSAMIPPSQLGETSVTVRPGTPTTVAIVMAADKEVIEPSEVELVEASGGVLPRTTKSFTLKFVLDDALAPVTDLEAVEVLTPDGDLDDVLDPTLFLVRGGAIVAKDVASLFAALKDRMGRPIVLRIIALDAAKFVHSDEIPFRIE